MLIQIANRTRTETRDLVVPCCQECNGAYARVEDQLAAAIRNGPTAVAALDRTATAAWAAKVLWGFVALEARFSLDRRDPAGSTILSPDQVELLRPLQRICQRWLAGDPVAGSLFVFNAQHENGDDFDYVDDPPAGLVGLRLSATALVICASDHGDAELLARDPALDLGYLPVFTDLHDLALGPVQFREVVAWASTLQRSRPPFPAEGLPFGAFDRELHRDRMERFVGELQAFQVTGIPRETTLFNPDSTPRFVPMSLSRALGRRVVRDSRS